MSNGRPKQGGILGKDGMGVTQCDAEFDATPRRPPRTMHAPPTLPAPRAWPPLGTDRRRCRSRANGDEDAGLGAEEGGAPGGGGDEGENRTAAGKKDTGMAFAMRPPTPENFLVTPSSIFL
jgi:hypothetical protein